MSAPGPRRSASDELLEQLMQAARRDEALTGSPPRARRRRRRALGLLAAVLLGGAAAAGAADLISTGDPVPDRTIRSPRYEPPAKGATDLATKAKDPDGAAPWGVAIYTSVTGEDCAVAGQVRGIELGLIRDGTFHAYERGTSGACADLSRLPLMHDRLQIRGAQPRTIVYGRTSQPERAVTVEVDGETFTTRPARGGAYVFVFAGNLRPNEAIPRLEPPRRR